MWNKSSLRVLVVCAGVCAAALLARGVFHAPHKVSAQSAHVRISLPEDWSHRHVVFSNTTNVQTLLSIRQDPRLLHQWLKHNVHPVNTVNMSAAAINSSEVEAADTDDDSSEVAESTENAREHVKRRHLRPNHVDWSVSLGTAGTHVPIYAYPAKFGFDISTADCVNDFVVFPTFIGTAGQASIVAYNQLYSTQGSVGGLCNRNGPAVKWAYLAGGGIASSPSISIDGTKVAWVSRSPARVHVLTIGTTGANGTSVTAPAIPGSGNNAVDRNFLLNGGPAVTRCSLFVDYADDVAYVGDDAGVLHKIVGVFLGTPAEVTTGGWPVTVSAGVVLTGPVFDFGSKNIFVGDSTGHLSYVRDVGSASGACASGVPPCKGSTVLTISSAGTAIQDSPIVDTSTGRVFTETANGNGTNSQIVQADTALGSVVRVNVGQADAANPLHSGTFDNNYFNAVNTGFYYVCGKAASGPARPTLYNIGFNAAGVLNASPGAAAIVLARAATQCSPAAEVFNTGATPQTDWLFVGVNTSCSASGGIAGGCMMSYNITAGMPAAFTARTAETGGTSGSIIDNVSTSAQASSIYFSTEANGACGDGIATGGCAVKLTQSGLL